MKTIAKSIAFFALFSLALSCTENEDSQQASTAKTINVKKLEEAKTVSSATDKEDDDMIHPKRKVTP